MTITNEAVEAANAAFNRIHATCEDAVRAALEAAEPFITAELRAKLARIEAAAMREAAIAVVSRHDREFIRDLADKEERPANV
jgi:DICT domain-containing protein